MNIASGLLVLALLGGDRTKVEQAEVCFNVHMMEMQGLQWRSDFFSRLKPVARKGTVTVWTSEAQTLVDLAKKADKIVAAPTITAYAGAPVHVDSLTKRSVVGGMTEHCFCSSSGGTSTVYIPQIDQHSEGFEAELVGRPCDQGVNTRLAFTDSRIAAVHSFKVAEPAGSTGSATIVHVPEIIKSQVDGEWVVPNGGVLIVSMGVFTASDAKGKAEVRERLMVIEAEPRAGFVEVDALKATFAAGRNRQLATPSMRPVPVELPELPQAAAPGAPDPIGPSLILPMAWPTMMPGATEAAQEPAPTPAPNKARVFAMALPGPFPGGMLRLSVGVASDPTRMPMAVPPTRHLPTAVAADGSIVNLPPLPEEVATAEESAETRPAPQARHVESPRAAPGGLVKAAPSMGGNWKRDAIELARTTKPNDQPVFDEHSTCPVDHSAKVETARPRLVVGELGPCEAWELTLPSATRIALENCEALRLLNFEFRHAKSSKEDTRPVSPEVWIAKLCRDASSETFHHEISALVRSVEQQYWALYLAGKTYAAQESALNLCEELARSNPASPEMLAQLEDFQGDFLKARSELAATERQLRRILGLPGADNRRIVPVTRLRADRVTFNVEQCLGEKLAARYADEKPSGAKSGILAGAERPGKASDREAIAAQFPGEQAADSPESSPAEIAMAAELTRLVGNVDVYYCGYRTAVRLKTLAGRRLDCVVREYEKGSVSANHLLDEVESWENALIQEAESGAMYNTAIVGVEECKGTLLKARGVRMAEPPAGTNK